MEAARKRENSAPKVSKTEGVKPHMFMETVSSPVSVRGGEPGVRFSAPDAVR